MDYKTVRIKAETHHRLRLMAAAQRTTIIELIERLTNIETDRTKLAMGTETAKKHNRTYRERRPDLL